MASQNLSITVDANDGAEVVGDAWYQQGQDDDTDYVGTYDSNDVEHAGWSFILTTEIPAGSTISKCYFSAYCLDISYAGDPEVALRIQDADPATVSVWSGSNLPSNASWVNDNAVAALQFAEDEWFFGEGDTHATNQTTDMQALVDDYGTLEVGDIINICLFSEEATGGEDNEVGFEDKDNAGGDEGSLIIEWTEPAPAATGRRRAMMFG